MTEPSSERQPRDQAMGRFLLGIGTGALLGVLTSLLPVIAVAVVGVLVVLTWISLARGSAGSARAVSTAGVLIGVGALLLYGAVSTITACSQTDDFCGHANVTPLLLLAIAAEGTGLVASGVAARARR